MGLGLAGARQLTYLQSDCSSSVNLYHSYLTEVATPLSFGFCHARHPTVMSIVPPTLALVVYRFPNTFCYCTSHMGITLKG